MHIKLNNDDDDDFKENVYRDTMAVEHEMDDYNSSNWSHWNNNKSSKEKFGSHTRKTFNRITIKDSYTGNITHNMESTAV